VRTDLLKTDGKEPTGRPGWTDATDWAHLSSVPLQTDNIASRLHLSTSNVRVSLLWLSM